MDCRWLAVVGCLCALVAMGRAAAVPTQDTMVVAREEQETVTPPSASDEAAKAASEATTEEPAPPVKLTEMTVHSEVSLRYAHTSMVTKVRNPAKKAQQVSFRVLLPETAFISGFVMILDGKPYKAYVKEKEEAKQIYVNAVNAGIGAAHIDAKARDSNQFMVSVNVEPSTTAVFNLTYEELLVRRNNVYNHAINLHPGALVPKLTVTVHIKEAQKITALRVPEIRTGNEIDASEEDPQNSKAVIVRGHDDREATITFSPTLDEQKQLIQIYADKTKESESHVHHLPQSFDEHNKPESVLGQFVVQYDVDRPQGGEILVNDGYFVHFFAPSELPPLHKHAVFVLDTSGSMMGRKVAQLQQAMHAILGELRPGDYFSIVEFDSSVTVHELKEAEQEPAAERWDSWQERPAALVPPARASPRNVARARTIVSRLRAYGGTNIASALNVAVELVKKGVDWQPAPPAPSTPAALPATPTPPAPTAAPATPATLAPPTDGPQPAQINKPEEDEQQEAVQPIIIFLTDGDPTVGETDPVKIVNRLTEKNYGKNKAAIFSLAFGEDADRGLLRKLSLRNDGFMRHIYEAADAALQLRDFYRQVSSPLLADVTFTYPKEQIKEGSLTKHKFRAYYAGSETVVAGRVADGGAGLAPRVVGVCGDHHNKRKKYEIFPTVPVARPQGEYLPLERVWAYLTIKQLLDERDAADQPADKDKEDSPEKKALQIALKYEFVTPLTSLVVVKPNATNSVDVESVDKPTYAASAGFPGPPSLSAPQFSYSHVSRPLSLHGYGGVGASLDSGLQHEAEDYSGGRGRGLSRLRSRTRHVSMIGASLPLQTTDTNKDSSISKSNLLSSRRYFSVPVSSFPMRTYTSQAFAEPSYNMFQSGLAYDAVDGYTREDDEAIASTPLLPTESPLERVNLAKYPWVRDALTSNVDRVSIEIDVPSTNNTNSSHISLDLTRDDDAPKEVIDAECARATDGATGVCVYLTRCHAARTITLDQYKQTYCYVQNKFAGVCCPRAEVDVKVQEG